MFLTNGIKAELIQFNRNTSSYYDDQDKQSIEIKVIPYNADQTISFGNYSVPEATGYFILRRDVDVKEGDQLVFKGRTYTILKVMDNWLYNRIENIGVAVK
jgi:hypothetical protein